MVALPLVMPEAESLAVTVKEPALMLLSKPVALTVAMVTSLLVQVRPVKGAVLLSE